MKKYIDEFIAFVRVEKNYSEHTVISYRRAIEGYITGAAIDDLREITKASIRSHLAKLQQEQMSVKTRNHVLAAIRSFCKFLSQEYNIANPSLEIQCGKVEKKLPEIMTTHQAGNIIDSAENIRDRAIMEILYACGLRVSELINLKVEDVSFESNSIKVTYGKGAKQRIVPITDTAKRVILDHMDKNQIDSEGYLFPSPRDGSKPITDRAARNIVYKYSEKVGAKTSPHKFRHSCATHLLAGGMDIRYIQELLGHSDINTTTIYAKVEMENLSRNFHLAHPRS